MIIKKLLVLIIALLTCSVLAGNNAELKKHEIKIIKNISYLSKATKDEYRKKMSVLDIYLPKGAKNFPTLVYFHGGGMTGGRRGGPSRLAKLGIAVVAVEYRLYPKCKHPEYIEDCAAATAWIFKNIKKYGGNPNKIFIGGYSAGSYLAAIIGMDKKYLKKHNIDADKLAGLLLQSGHTITHFTVRKQFGYKVRQGICDENAPMYHIRKTPFPILLQCGDNDYPSRQEENRLFESMMIRYAKQPRSLIKYREYPGTHGTLPRNLDFQNDTMAFVLKNSAMPSPKYSEAKKTSIAYSRSYGNNNYVEVSGLQYDAKKAKIQIAGKSFQTSASGVVKLQNKSIPSYITITQKIQIKKIASVKEYHLKDGKKNALKFLNAVSVWTEKGNIVFQINKKTSKIKAPQNGRYYTGDGIEIFVDRTPLRKLSRTNNSAFPEALNIKQYLFSAVPDKKRKSMAVVLQSNRGENITKKSQAKLVSKLIPCGYSMQMSIPLGEISPLNSENIIGLNIQVNNFESGKNKKINLANSKEPSHTKRFHYPLFNISAFKK